VFAAPSLAVDLTASTWRRRWRLVRGATGQQSGSRWALAKSLRARAHGWPPGSSAVGSPAPFPPQEVAQVKAIACELPREAGVPLSRFARAELYRLVIERGVTGRRRQRSRAGLQRTRSSHGSTARGSSRAIRASLKRPVLRTRPARVLDRRKRLLTPRPGGGRPPASRVAEPAAGPPGVLRLLAHQIEIIFSVIQRKVLTPNDFASLQAVVDRLDAFGHPLQPDRQAVRVELHPPRPRRPHRPRIRSRAAAQARRLTATGLTATTTRPASLLLWTDETRHS
jgi:hypothetical protein